MIILTSLTSDACESVNKSNIDLIDNTEEQEYSVQGRLCFKILWNSVPVGLVSEIEGAWHFSREMKGEYWSLNSFETKESAIEHLVEDRRALDEYRIDYLTGK